MISNKKGTSPEGMNLNLDQMAIWIFFILVAVLLVVLLFARINPTSFNQTAYPFGKSIFDMMTGKGG
jgi:hypothetical protein